MGKGKFIFKTEKEIEKALEMLHGKEDSIRRIVVEKHTQGEQYTKQPTTTDTKFHIDLSTYFEPPEE